MASTFGGDEEHPSKKMKIHDDGHEEIFEPLSAASVISVRLMDLARGGEESLDYVFHPEYIHQIFGEDEEINGYSGLRVQIFIDANSFFSHVAMTYDERSNDADEVVETLVDALEPGLLRSQELYLSAKSLYGNSWLQFEDFGRIFERSSWKRGELAIAVDTLASASTNLREAHARLEPFLTFFIDGFSPIDPNDANWEIFSAVYSIEDSIRLVGFAMVYNLTAFPTGKRKRIGQIFVLPNYQGAGLGTKLLHAIYTLAEECGATDVTLEDPSRNMLTLRDKLDVSRIAKCSWARRNAAEVLHAHCKRRASRSELQNGAAEGNTSASEARAIQTSIAKSIHGLALVSEQEARIQASLKIPRTQIPQLWDALLMIETKGDPGLVSCVREYVACCMENVWKTNVGFNKVIIECKDKEGNKGDGFIMLKCCNIPPIGHAIKQGLIFTPPEAGVQDQKKLKIEEEVDHKMEELVLMASIYWK